MVKKIITIGIQGGKGSFNEKAILTYFAKNNITNYKIKYLYTTEKVLKELNNSKIDMGQFAIQNSIGGIVNESIQAMAKYIFKIVDQFSIEIAHALMISKDASFVEIDTIMTHPQVLSQCKLNLGQKYSQLKQTSGTGDLIDHSNVAKYLSKNKLPKNIAVMGSNILAEIYNLKIVEDNLQDRKDNLTTFLIVSK